jgi:hypothetical protein
VLLGRIKCCSKDAAKLTTAVHPPLIFSAKREPSKQINTTQ